MAKFKEIRELALQYDLALQEDLALQDEVAAEVWDIASSIRKLAMEIQELLGVSPDEAYSENPEPEGQDHQDLWGMARLIPGSKCAGRLQVVLSNITS